MAHIVCNLGMLALTGGLIWFIWWGTSEPKENYGGDITRLMNRPK